MCQVLEGLADSREKHLEDDDDGEEDEDVEDEDVDAKEVSECDEQESPQGLGFRGWGGNVEGRSPAWRRPAGDAVCEGSGGRGRLSVGASGVGGGKGGLWRIPRAVYR